MYGMVKKIVFIRAHFMNGVKWPVGTKAQVREKLYVELSEKKLIQEYTGEWPPKKKMKFNLKDLK